MDGIIKNSIAIVDNYAEYASVFAEMNRCREELVETDYKLIKAVEAMLHATSTDDLMRIIAEQREALGYILKDRKEELP